MPNKEVPPGQPKSWTKEEIARRTQVTVGDVLETIRSATPAMRELILARPGGDVSADENDAEE